MEMETREKSRSAAAEVAEVVLDRTNEKGGTMRNQKNDATGHEEHKIFIPGELVYDSEQVEKLLKEMKEAVRGTGEMKDQDIEKQFQEIQVVAGSGVYEMESNFYSSVVGTCQLTSAERLVRQLDSQEINLPESFSTTLKMIHPASIVIEVAKAGTDASMRLPRVGSVVTGRIVRITSNVATMEILVVDGRSIVSQQKSFRGIIRKENVRESEIDKVKMHECYRPGDLVSAEVVSLGDARSYFLSTAKVELGVVYAKSEAGYPLTPASWQEMVCTRTNMHEKRKVAKIDMESFGE